MGAAYHAERSRDTGTFRRRSDVIIPTANVVNPQRRTATAHIEKANPVVRASINAAPLRFRRIFATPAAGRQCRGWGGSPRRVDSGARRRSSNRDRGGTGLVVQLDAKADPVEMPGEVFHELCEHARNACPEECCGLVFGTAHQRYARAVRCRNEATVRTCLNRPLRLPAAHQPVTLRVSAPPQPWWLHPTRRSAVRKGCGRSKATKNFAG